MHIQIRQAVCTVRPSANVGPVSQCEAMQDKELNSRSRQTLKLEINMVKAWHLHRRTHMQLHNAHSHQKCSQSIAQGKIEIRTDWKHFDYYY